MPLSMSSSRRSPEAMWPLITVSQRMLTFMHQKFRPNRQPCLSQSFGIHRLLQHVSRFLSDEVTSSPQGLFSLFHTTPITLVSRGTISVLPLLLQPPNTFGMSSCALERRILPREPVFPASLCGVGSHGRDVFQAEHGKSALGQ